MTNPLLGHYVWYIKCKRYEYSYEPGIEVGPNDKQLSDAGDYGRLPEGENPPELFQPYTDSVQNSSKCIYDYYAEYDLDLKAKTNRFVSPKAPSCPSDVTVSSLNKVPGPYEKQTHTQATDEQMAIFVATGILSATVPEADLIQAQSLLQTALIKDKNNIMTRTLVSEIDGEKTFKLETTNKEQDDIIYTTSLSAFALKSFDGEIL